MSAQAFSPASGRVAWRRIARHPALMEYRRLAALVAMANLWILWRGWQMGHFADGMGWALAPIADLALANFALAILIRQQRVINALFWLATRIPVTWPLWLRRGAGKVYHFGGLHSGAASCGTLWFGLLLWAMGWNRLAGDALPSDRTLWLTAAILLLLAAMVATALGPLRDRFHNLFERVHRFAGWTVMGLFWAQSISLSAETGEAPPIWLLALLTLSVISPWLSLRRVRVAVDTPSGHAAVARFDYGETPFAGSSTAISRSPFGEYHAFANIPAPGESGFRLAISRAGDWTGGFVDQPPSHVWVKGITTSGVARIETLFSRVVYVATGSGIGPVLPHLLKGAVPARLIWSARSPRRTYGDALVDEIETATAHPLIWDTDRDGKPDLSALALEAVWETGAEAVIVISNRKLTRRVVHELETLGIPAYGAIWDS
ncbi:hypothetical protein [Mangrovicoccus sp. HB161399]|uniref:hypothetical protein n=1 Tax=Mangrovicoccus sp. HB161399 TaxID=2720392 RepID=UPI0015576CAB|nr:hypothetical protein [Mangrovicoccus sp. HB161399]